MNAPTPVEIAPPTLTEDLEDLYENAPCGYLSMGPDGRIFKANATLAAWMGLPAARIVGAPFLSLLTIGSRLFFEMSYAPLLSIHGGFDGVAFDLKTASGERLPVFANGVARREAGGRLAFTRLTLFKAAERRRYERELVDGRMTAETAQAQSAALETVTRGLLDSERETSKLREQFIAVLGHDLRNPLASMASGVRLLAKDPQTERGRQLLALMQGSANRMAGLIDNVLDFARGRLGGGIALNLQPSVQLEPVLHQVVSELRTSVPDYEILADICVPEPVDCDPTRLGQLVSNLLGNALTHGSTTEPVRLRAATEVGALTVWVANGGKAIPSEAMERLFHPFFRGEVRASQQGLGLGLHIASEIAKAHRGALTVESSEAETRFIFLMPLVAVSDEAASEETQRARPSLP